MRIIASCMFIVRNIVLSSDFHCRQVIFFGISHKKILKLFNGNENNEFIYDFTNIPYTVKHIVGEKIDKYMVLNKYFEK